MNSDLITRLRAYRDSLLEGTTAREDLTLAISTLQGKAEAKRKVKRKVKRIDHILSRESIVKALETSPMTVTQISRFTGLVGLTIRNHLRNMPEVESSMKCFAGRAPVKIYNLIGKP